MTNCKQTVEPREIFFRPDLADRFPQTDGMWYETEEEQTLAFKRFHQREMLLAWVRRAMEHSLTKKQRRAVELHYFEGMSSKEVARQLRCHKASVNRHLRCAIAILRVRARLEMPEHFQRMRRREEVDFVLSLPEGEHQNS